jgi:glycosyltransferase involved in cell wall biosynthesis
VKLAVVVQRYGADINGGAELHARYVAEHLARHAQVTVLTTCARDYVTWHDEYPAGVEQVNGVPVHRFPVDHERDEAIGLGMTPPLFRGVRALMYNSPEERRMIQAAARNEDVPGVVVGIGSEIPAQGEASAERFRQKFGITGRFALYLGRIDQNKGCNELFTFFLRALPALPKGLGLVLVGKEILPIPDHPRIRHLGFLYDQDKYDALAAADLLVMPSYYESLSMVALEAWALGKPVLVNGKCEVLRGQCIRSRAGLYYETQAEFVETLRAIADWRSLNTALGRNGQQFFSQHYAWPVIEQKYLDMLARLQEADRSNGTRTKMEPEPGFVARRRKSLRPAAEVLSELPSGPVLN